MKQETKPTQEQINFYPIPQHASLVISTDENFATAEELVSVAMHLALNQPDRKLQYWIRIERED